MANKSLAVVLTLIIELSVNAAANVDDVNSLNFHDKNYIRLELQVPTEKYDTSASELKLSMDSMEAHVQVNDSKVNEIKIIQESELLKNERVIDLKRPMIALTYDDGPSKYTHELLDVLKENNSAATFFVLGLQVDKNKDVVSRMVEEGNQVGNHSFDHKRLTILSDEELYDQMSKTDNLVYDAALYNTYVMRPPYGSTTENVIEKLYKPIIKWSIDTRDWESRNAESIVEIVLNNVKDGDIILMHDIYESSLAASKKIIPELIKRGYQLVTVSEMAEYRNVDLKSGQTYYNMYK